MRHAVIHNGVVSNVIDAPEGWSIPGETLVAADGLQVGPGDLWDGEQFTRPEIAQPAPQLAPYDFMRLFTPAERLAILQSADPVIMLARADLQTISSVVDCGHPDTINYVGYLAQQGLIGSERPTQILAGEAPQ